LSRPSIFISYSHKDEDWKDHILLRLGIAQKQELFDVWDDRRIEGGEDWFKAITKTTCRCQSKQLFRYQTPVRTIRAGNRSGRGPAKLTFLLRFKRAGISQRAPRKFLPRFLIEVNPSLGLESGSSELHCDQPKTGIK
jgi:hypothetical protein